MKIYAETERLILREMLEEDAPGILAMDRDPEVLRYLPVTPIHTIAEARNVIGYIRKQYVDNGIGRWTMVNKEDGAFMGWCGIKYVNEQPTNGRIGYYDIGYRLLPAYWNKGYAFEAALACKRYAFAVLQLEELHATVMEGNTASGRVAEKLGMKKIETFEEDGRQWSWYTISSEVL
jgi:[ribosomal protein S5]-alanine N-acetyltransferase